MSQDKQQQAQEQPQQKRARRRRGAPLGVPRRRLSADEYQRKYPDKVFRWINEDEMGRIDRATQGGYDFVRRDGELIVGDGDPMKIREGLGSCVSQVVGEGKNGKPQTAYLMAIDRDWYDEDQRAKQKQVDMVEDSLRRAKKPTGEPEVERQYIPEEGRRIEHARR